MGHVGRVLLARYARTFLVPILTNKLTWSKAMVRVPRCAAQNVHKTIACFEDLFVG